MFLQGGFDCVIGNPPYGASFQKYEKDYLKKAYPFGDIEFESYLLFIQKSYLILKMGGRQGFIIPSNLFTNVRYEKTRALMLQKTTINDLIDLGSNVFSQASVDTCIEVFQKGYTPNNQIKTFIGNIGKVKDFAYHYILQDEMQKNASYLFDIYSSDFEKVLESKIEINTQPLENFVSFARGVEFGYKSSYITDDAKANNAQPIIAGRCIQRYNLRFEGKYVLYDETDLANFKSKDIYETEKILLRRIGNEIIAVYDNENYYNVCDVYNLLPKNILDLKYILALLNSKLMSFYLQTKFKNSKKLFPKIPIKYLEQLPIKPLDLQNKENKTIHKNIVSYVNDLADLHKELNALPQNATEAQKVVIQKKIKRKQQVIDTAVYNLYNLDEADIKLIDKNYVVLESF
ncbi:MAG: hypothetical protein EAZ95_12930 [Bacteroidetes bacterium]|nr:MAG: hypothetical protein EAZ95_12930 [Bacteroidota bacterium]